MKKINKMELEFPQLRLITKDHKQKFFNALSLKDEIERKKQCDLIIDDICKDIKWTDEKYILKLTMTNYMLDGLLKLMIVFDKIK